MFCLPGGTEKFVNILSHFDDLLMCKNDHRM